MNNTKPNANSVVTLNVAALNKLEAVAQALLQAWPEAVLLTTHGLQLPEIEGMITANGEVYLDGEELPETRNYVILGLDLPSDAPSGVRVWRM